MAQFYPTAATLATGFPADVVRPGRSRVPSANPQLPNPQLPNPKLANPQLAQLHRHLATAGGRLYLGAGMGGVALAPPEQAVLVLGPPRSGKTTALAIPNVLAAPGAVVVTSTKADVLAATAGARAALGRCWLLDPSGTIQAPEGMTRLRWSPVGAATTWDESLVLARAMTGAARPQGRAGESAHWTERAEAVLGPLLHAAHLSGAGMDTVVRWVLGQQLEPARAALVGHGVDTAAAVLAGIAATDAREQSGIWSSTAGILAAYRSDAALDNAAAPNFDPRRLAGGKDTVYVCAPARYQDLVAPIVVAFLEQVRAGVYAAAPTGRPAVALVLDELANIAPIPDLPALVSEGGGQGLLTLACLQDLSQARQRWGPAAEGFLSLFGTKVVLPGIGDLATLDLVSRLGGEIDVPARSVNRPSWGWGAASVTWATHRQRRLPVEAVSQQPPGAGLVLAGARPPERVGLPPWWAVPMFQPVRVPEQPSGRSISG
ncbi:MAG TPA: type IV secretory system conjugative DNA transfer family protein [Acidimicrobiales bacterium]|jgi:type IV secretory pathway TraG/TraD family ATPase VirD4